MTFRKRILLVFLSFFIITYSYYNNYSAFHPQEKITFKNFLKLKTNKQGIDSTQDELLHKKRERLISFLGRAVSFTEIDSSAQDFIDQYPDQATTDFKTRFIVNDNKPTWFVAHNDSEFSDLINLRFSDSVLIYKESGEPVYYKVVNKETYWLNNVGRLGTFKKKSDNQKVIKLLREKKDKVILQTCIKIREKDFQILLIELEKA